MKLKGKKIACFLALPHHSRFFISMQKEIQKEGGELIFIVTLGGYPYELDLIRRNLPFRFFRDYMSAAVKEKIKNATATLMMDWAKRCFSWEGFSRWPLFKQSWFFEGVVEEYFCIEAFMEVERPDMFIAHHECNRWGQVIGHLCRQNAIPFITFQEGDYYNDYMGFVLHTEYSVADLLWGEKTRRRLREYRCSEDKMFLIGNTHIESAVKLYSTKKAIAGIKKELKIPLKEKVILFLVDIKYGAITKEETWKSFLQGLDRLEAEATLIFKWHPAVMKNTYDEIKKVFQVLCPGAILLYDYEPYKLLALSDYCVTMGKTTLAIEALAFGKPLFALPNADTLEDYYVKTGIAQTAFPPGNWSNLFNTIEKGPPPEIRSKVEAYLTDSFYKLDGKSVDRAIDCMSYVIGVKAEIQRKGRREKMTHKTKQAEVVPGRVSFIVPSGAEPETFLATLTSLSQHVPYPDWELVIVVHHDNVKGLLPGLSGDLSVVEVESGSLGYLYNQGVKAATGEHLIFMTPGTLLLNTEGIAAGLESGIVGVPVKDAEMAPYCLGIGFDFNASPYRITEASKPAEAVGGGFLALRREIYDALEGFDEEIANHLIEADLCLKGKEAGIAIQYANEALAVKYKESYYGDDVSDVQWKNRVRFFAKWAGKLPKDEDFVAFAGDLLKVKN